MFPDPARAFKTNKGVFPYIYLYILSRGSGLSDAFKLSAKGSEGRRANKRSLFSTRPRARVPDLWLVVDAFPSFIFLTVRDDEYMLIYIRGIVSGVEPRRPKENIYIIYIYVRESASISISVLLWPKLRELLPAVNQRLRDDDVLGCCGPATTVSK